MMNQSSNPGMMMMFGSRVRIQSGGNLNELDFNNKNGGLPTQGHHY